MHIYQASATFTHKQTGCVSQNFHSGKRWHEHMPDVMHKETNTNITDIFAVLHGLSGRLSGQLQQPQQSLKKWGDPHLDYHLFKGG